MGTRSQKELVFDAHPYSYVIQMSVYANCFCAAQNLWLFMWIVTKRDYICVHFSLKLSARLKTVWKKYYLLRRKVWVIKPETQTWETKSFFLQNIDDIIKNKH